MLTQRSNLSPRSHTILFRHPVPFNRFIAAGIREQTRPELHVFAHRSAERKLRNRKVKQYYARRTRERVPARSWWSQETIGTLAWAQWAKSVLKAEKYVGAFAYEIPPKTIRKLSPLTLLPNPRSKHHLDRELNTCLILVDDRTNSPYQYSTLKKKTEQYDQRCRFLRRKSRHI